MSQEIDNNPSLRKKKILFIFPLVYRPLEDNFSGKFRLLSHWYSGQIFALSGGKQRNLPVSEFLFHSEKYGNSVAARFLLGLWIQIFVPLKLLWGKTPVDAVVAYDPYRSGVAAVILKHMLRCKMIVEFNGDYHRTEPGLSLARRISMRFMLKLVLRCTDAIKVLNTDQEAFCRRTVQHKPIYRYANFVATEYFRSLESWQGDYLLSVGYPFGLKGMDVLIAAFRQVAERHQHISLRIMGYCPEGELVKYKTLAGGHSRIAFVEPGWIQEVSEQMRGCYALVNAARSEAMGRVHIEAMACGKPIVASRTNGGVLCVEDRQTGLLCEIDNIEDLATKLDELLSNPDRANRMGQAGKMRMQEMFSEKAHMEAFHGMMEEVTGRATAS